MLRTYRTEYERLLPLVEKPARYLGNERGAVRKDLAHARLRFALAFPEVYEIAQSHLGLQVLYDILNRRPEIAAERVYAPWPDLEALLRRRDLPLVSLENHLALHDFHLIGFSLQYELTYTNLLTMLELGRVPWHSAARGLMDPIVIAGGPCAFNPEPLAPFLDAVLLGDGEEAVGDIADAVLRWDGRERSALLEALAEIPGVYVPAFFTPRYASDGTLTEVVATNPARPVVQKRVLPDLNKFAPPPAPVVPNLGVVHDRASVEVMRGCVKGCRFCQAGYIYRPLRERDPEALVTQATELIERTGYEELSLLSLSTGDYSGVNPVLRELMNRLEPERVAVSLPSTRVDALSPQILEQIRRVRKTGFTLAPEAGTQRLRDVIQKEYKEEELLAAARLFADLGWRSLKLYFMIGLPSETEEDVLGIAELAAKVRRASENRLKVTASVSTFSPKPHTPFQWAGQLAPEDIRARQSLLRRELARRGVEFRWHSPELTWLEGVFARGDRRLADVLATAQRMGARFDGWSEHFKRELWAAALSQHGLDAPFYLRRRPLGEVLPWDHLDAGVSKRFLRQDLARAVEGRLTPDCSIERCTYCGACDFKQLRNIDYHLTGAKGGLHRGQEVSRWAELVVPNDDSGPPQWETKAWRDIRARVAARRAAVPTPLAMDVDTPLPATVENPAGTERPGGGEGNAEEWLDAVQSSLAPAHEAPPPVQRIRLRYAKDGPARFIGMRELGTVFLRAARRAKLPMAFSQGHHPLPRLSFGPALPLGFSSADEYIDLELTTASAPEEIAAAFARELPTGLRPLSAHEVSRSAAAIDAQVRSFVYDIDLAHLDDPPAPAVVADAVTRFAAAATFPVTKQTKTGPKTVDARRFVKSLCLAGPQRLTLEVTVSQEGTLKPGAVLEPLLALTPDAVPSLRVHKVTTYFAEAEAGMS